jgi:hypothetical protein
VAPLLVVLVGCGDDGSADGSSAGTGSGASGTGASGTGGAGGSGNAGTGATGGGSGGAGAGGTGGTCTHELQSVTVSPSSGGAGGPVYAAAASNGDVVIAWASGGSVRVARADATGAIVGAEGATTGQGVHGLALNGDAVGLLVARGTDELALVELDASGGETTNVMLTGQSDHDLIGSEWYSYSPQFAADGGRLHWTGTQYVAYFPIFRRWPDNIAHTGDTLRFLSQAGVQAGGGWSWGCSHSLDVRLAQSGDTVAPVCLSDCYAQKAILHSDSKVISAEPSGNCGGSSSAALGGLVPQAGAFWLTYLSPEGRSSKDVGLAKLALDGTLQETSWLTDNAVDESGAHLAAFEGGLLAGWKEGSVHYLAQLDATGTIVDGPMEIAASFRDKDDFFAFPNGDVGWVWPDGASFTVYRYRSCAP